MLLKVKIVTIVEVGPGGRLGREECEWGFLNQVI